MNIKKRFIPLVLLSCAMLHGRHSQWFEKQLEDLDRHFDSMFTRVAHHSARPGDVDAPSYDLNVAHANDEVTISINAPAGVAADDVTAEVQDGVLDIKLTGETEILSLSCTDRMVQIYAERFVRHTHEDDKKGRSVSVGSSSMSKANSLPHAVDVTRAAIDLTGGKVTIQLPKKQGQSIKVTTGRNSASHPEENKTKKVDDVEKLFAEDGDIAAIK